MTEHCRALWGSHACEKPAGHRWGHVCCCRNPLHVVFHWGNGCVGRWPYYGRNTSFYE